MSLSIVECSVCSQPMPKSRVHYGGVSCYSCRAFFRRNTQKQERNVCKEAGQCTVTHKDRKVCTDCRYQKCIRYGNINIFPLAQMGVLAPGSVQARPSARPPIDTSVNFPAHMSAESPSNISPNPSEVISEVSEP